MSNHSEMRGTRVLQFLGALSLLFGAVDAQAITASPSPSYNGSYTVSWSSSLGCTYNDDPPFYSYQCTSLLENGVEIASSGYSLPITGRAAGSYEYQVYYTMYVYGQPYDGGTVEGPVTVLVGTPPPRDSLPTQLTYQYQTRAGDLNYDGRTDLFVKRTSGGVAGNGVLQEVILQQNASGGFSPYVPDSYYSSVASGWPLSTATAVVTDFNVDGYADVEVKGVSTATGGLVPDDQIIYSSGVPLQPQPRGIRAVDDALKQFIGNSLDYLVDPDYFTNYATVQYYSGYFYYYTCSFYPYYSGIIDDYYYGAWYYCSIYYQAISGYYWDYSGFNPEAVTTWSNQEAYENGTVTAEQATNAQQQAAEDVLGVEIGGWPMEEVLGSEGEHTDANVRRALEVFWAILGIGRANAQQVDTDEAPAQNPRTGSDIYLVGHGAKIWGVPTGNHVALEFNSNTAIPCSTNTIPTCSTISAHPRSGGKLYYVPNAPEDTPLLNMTMGTVTRAPTSSAALWAEMIAKAQAYGNDADYNALCLPLSSGYNSNSFIVGLIQVVGAMSDYDLPDLWCGSRPLPASYYE